MITKYKLVNPEEVEIGDRIVNGKHTMMVYNIFHKDDGSILFENPTMQIPRRELIVKKGTKVNIISEIILEAHEKL